MFAEPREMNLVRRHDRVYARLSGEDREVPVKLVWARPVSGKGQEVSVLGTDKKELFLLKSLEGLDPASRRVAEEELDQRYLVPRIRKVLSTYTNFGARYWHVETDRGDLRFVMKDPSKNVTWVTADRMILRDTLGNRYEIESYAGLDARSRSEIDKVI
jgi:hypothetical protein